MPRNARNDSTVSLNSTWRFFDINYMKADCPMSNAQCPCCPANQIFLDETFYCKLIVILIRPRKATFRFTFSRTKI